MAEYGNVTAFTGKAAADLTAQLYHFVRVAGVDGVPTVNVASHDAAAPDVGLVGVLQNKPRSGEAATIGYFGESKLVAGAAVTAGKMLTTNGSGRAIHAGSGDWVMARAMASAGDDGHLFNALVFPAFKLVGTN